MAIADTTLKVNVDTADAQRSLATLQSRFEGLKTAILGVGFAAAIAQANNYANAVKDVSVASDLSIASVVALSKAFEANGGTAAGAQDAMLRFSQSVGAAIEGNANFQRALIEAGVSLKDLQTLTRQQQFDKYIAGLAGIGNQALRTKNQLEVLGKQTKGVDFGGGVQGTLATQTISAGDIAAIQSGAAAAENMKKMFGELTQALLNVARPLNDLVSNINIGVKNFESLIRVLTYAATAFLVFGRLLPAIQNNTNAFYKAITAVGGAAAATGKQIAALGGHFTRMLGHLVRVITNTGQAGSRMASLGLAVSQALKFLTRFAGIASIVMLVVEAVNTLIRAITGFDVMDWVVEKFVKLKNAALDYFGISRGATDEEKAAMDKQQKALEDQKKALEEAAAAKAEFAKRQREMAAELAKVGNAYAVNNDLQLQAIALETRLIGKTEDETEALRGLADIANRGDEAIRQLNETRKQYSKESATPEQKAAIGLIDTEIKRIKDLTTTHQKDYLEYINIQQGKKMLEADRIRQVENLTKAIEDQIRITEALGQARLDMIGKQKEVDFQQLIDGLNPFQQKIAQIQEDARKSALEAGRVFASAFEEGGDGLTPERAKQLSDGLAEIADGYKKIADQQIANLQQSRSFADGWKRAFEEYADSAYNASETARSLFTTATKGMEDALVNFAKNGKLEWKGFLGSIVEELLRSNIRQLITQAFGGAGKGGSGGLFGSLLGGGAGGTGGGSFLDSIFGGFKSLFSGFFADGGMIPAGGYGVVGERGPELISGPAQITPMDMGGTTQVTYNINAVDASSFRNLVASDPEFIFAVTEQGRRRLPGNRR